MYPPQTSFIPVQVALARFLESQGLKAIISDYPYWYLGTTPFRYLTGPVLPGIMSVIHRLLPGLDLFTVFYLILGMVWPLGGVGVYLLLRELMIADKGLMKADNISEDQRSKSASISDRYQRVSAIVAAIFFTLGPIVPFLFRFSDGISLISFSILPYALIFYTKLLKKNTPKNRLLFIITISLILLIDISIFSTLFLGMAAVFLTVSGWKNAEKKIKRSFAYLLICLLVISVWYGPGYWWRILLAPSFAGKSLVSVVSQLGQLLPVALAITLAVLSGRFFKKKPKKSQLPITNYYLLRFSFFWLFIFGFLTLMRFIADPDFWLDWMSYGMELQLGLAMVLALGLARINTNYKLMIANVLMVVLVFGSWTYLFNEYILKTMQKDITQSVEYKIGKALIFADRVVTDVADRKLIDADQELMNADSKHLQGGAKTKASLLGGEPRADDLSPGVEPGKTVFLSGSTVFWLNAFFDIPQVRGGNDGPSKDSDWREAAWEIREGEEAVRSIEWLEKLKVDYLVVHTEVSQEFWHDFKHPEKFEGADGLEKVYDQEGDRIYRVEDR
ncbi:hypothetical protein ACFL0Y_04715 [Patescibacteria group bacterium]